MTWQIDDDLYVTRKTGLGIEQPQERLEVNGKIKTTDLQASGIVQALSFQGDGSNLTGVVKKAGDTITGALTVQNNLTVTGNVGIATTVAPTERLEVNGNVKANFFLGDGSSLTGVVKNLDSVVKKVGDTMTGALTINQGTQSSFGGHLFLSKIDGSPGRGQWHINIAPNNALNFVETGIADYRLTIAPGGNVGIGTNPMATLHIKQTANNSGIRLDEFGSSRYFNIAYEGQGNIHFYHQNTIGQWMGPDGTWKHNSDISLKKDISSMNNILDKVIQLNPVHFTWKDSNLSNIGFIAQEVQQIFPELVSSVNRNGDNLKGLSYDSFGVIAIAAIKEMKSKYDQEIKILQEQIKILQEQIAKILTEKSKL
jgi:hypothetical protein